MFLVFLLLPLVFALALRRLVGIPRQMACGSLRLAQGRRALRGAAAAAAYLTLLGYSAGLALALAHAVVVAADRTAAWLALAGWVLGYPLVYFCAAWVFFHAFERPGGGR